jgi:hypothetical protein
MQDKDENGLISSPYMSHTFGYYSAPVLLGLGQLTPTARPFSQITIFLANRLAQDFAASILSALAGEFTHPSL